jgi:hypothetical protein
MARMRKLMTSRVPGGYWVAVGAVALFGAVFLYVAFHSFLD